MQGRDPGCSSATLAQRRAPTAHAAARRPRERRAAPRAQHSPRRGARRDGAGQPGLGSAQRRCAPGWTFSGEPAVERRADSDATGRETERRSRRASTEAGRRAGLPGVIQRFGSGDAARSGGGGGLQRRACTETAQGTRNAGSKRTHHHTCASVDSGASACTQKVRSLGLYAGSLQGPVPQGHRSVSSPPRKAGSDAASMYSSRRAV